jgi:hypothetical protein
VRRKSFILLEDRDLDPIWRLVVCKDYRSTSEMLDVLRDIGRFTPDVHFLFKRVALCKDADKIDTYRRAILELLRDWQRLDVPLSQQTSNLVANELERLWWPKIGKRRRLAEAEILREAVDRDEILYREMGEEQPRSKAKNEVAGDYSYASGETLRKALQVNRVNRKTRRKPGG